MTVTRRSVMWPLIIIGIGSVWLLSVAGAFPEAVEDIFGRSWPALLVLFGIDVLAGHRRFRVARLLINTSYVAVLFVMVLLVVVVVFAYRNQAGVYRTDHVETFSKVLPDAVESVEVLIDLQRTTVDVVPADEYERELAFRFTGSNESDVAVGWELLGETGVLSVAESYRNTVPPLDDYGRGKLLLTLPVGVSVELFDLSVDRGNAVLDLGAISVPSLELRVNDGDVRLALPDKTAQYIRLARIKFFIARPFCFQPLYLIQNCPHRLGR